MTLNVFHDLYNKIYSAKDKYELSNWIDESINITNNKLEKNLIKSLDINDFKIKRIETYKFIAYLDLLDKINYFSEIRFIINRIRDMTDDEAQIKTLERIISFKKEKEEREDPLEVFFKDDGDIEDTKEIFKPCPHCNNVFIGNEKTTYLICGYSRKGFDWKGCGKDWCFKCGKKLCKCWNIDSLFDISKRFHDKRCCKYYAHRLMEDYDNFCQCKDWYVNRNK